MIPNRIVFAGSSSIHGRGDSELGGFVHRFRLWHESCSGRHFVYELGIFGESTQALISRVATEAAVRRPHLIVLYPGFNDIRRDAQMKSNPKATLNSLKGSIKKLIANAQSVAPVLMMTGIPFDETRTTPYSDSESFYFKEDAEKLTEMIRLVCKECRVPVLDYFSLWACEDLKKLLADDGLHANCMGHLLLFEQLRDFIVNEYQ